MFRHLLFVIGLLFSWSLSADTLRVSTFNAEFLYTSKVHIKYGLKYNMGDNSAAEQAQWANPSFRTQQFDAAVDAVAEQLASIDTDVLILTEVGKANDLQALVDALEDEGADYPHVEACDCSDPTGQNVAVLSKRPFLSQHTLRKLPGRQAYDVEVDDPDEEHDTGISKGIRVAIEVENGAGAKEPVFIYGVHLASERGGHEKDQQRIAQASIVRAHSVPLLTEGKHVIIAGDMNDRRGQPTIRRLRGMDDIWPDLIQTGHWKFFDQGEEATRWTYEFRGEHNQIDHVLVSYSLRKNQTSSISTSVKAIPKQTNPAISDHRPLTVSIDIP